jgi:hypothetical protein
MFALRMVEMRSRMPTTMLPLSYSTRRRADAGVQLMHTTDGGLAWLPRGTLGWNTGGVARATVQAAIIA